MQAPEYLLYSKDVHSREFGEGDLLSHTHMQVYCIVKNPDSEEISVVCLTLSPDLCGAFTKSLTALNMFPYL